MICASVFWPRLSATGGRGIRRPPFQLGSEYGLKIRAVVASTPLVGLELDRQVALTLDQEVSFGTARIAATHSNSNAADREQMIG
jgi:hypothetical protein